MVKIKIYSEWKVIDVYTTESISYINIPLRASLGIFDLNGDMRILIQ